MLKLTHRHIILHTITSLVSVNVLVVYFCFPRIDACVAAVENARLKACEMSSRLGQVLGLPLVVREEDASEWTDEEGAEERGGRPPHRPTLTVSSRVFVSFNLRPRKKL